MFVALAFAVIVFPLVWRANRRRPFDVVHLHGDWFEAVNGVLFWKILGIPSVLTVHAGLNSKRAYRLLAGPAFRRMPGIIAHSKEIRDELVSMGVSVERITLSHSGIWVAQITSAGADRPVDENVVSPAGDRIGGESASGPYTVLRVGRLHTMKGQRYLIEAIRLLPKQPSVKTVLAGDGPNRDELRRLAAGSPNEIEFVGELMHDALIRLLHRADVFALPSVSLAGQRESTPTALLEAMAAGLPIITTPSGGIRDIIEDGHNGIIVPERNAQALAEAIRKLTEDEQLRAEMGARNREQAAEYDWSRVAGMVRQVYINVGAPK